MLYRDSVRLALFEREAQELSSIIDQYQTLHMQTWSPNVHGRMTNTTETDLEDIQARLTMYERLAADIRRRMIN